jgi:hypothetical protein
LARKLGWPSDEPFEEMMRLMGGSELPRNYELGGRRQHDFVAPVARPNFVE